MGILIRAGLLVFLLGIIPFLVGMLYTKKKKYHADEILNNWVCGFLLCLGMFQLLVIPCIFLKKSLTFLSAAYGILLAIACLGSLAWNRKRLGRVIRNAIKSLKGFSWVTLLALLVILFQMYVYVAYMHVDDDDAFYVATSVTSVEEDSLFQVNPYTGDAYKKYPARYVLSPFPVFVAVLSRMSGIHATLLSHTVLPAVLLPLAYGVFALIGYELFMGDRKKTACFVFLAALIQMYLSGTVYMQGSFMLLRIWQGKAVLAAALLPLLLCQGLRILRGEWERADWPLLMALMLACCLVSSMGIMLGAVMLGIMGIALGVVRREGKLLVKMALCAVPNLLYAAMYLFVV